MTQTSEVEKQAHIEAQIAEFVKNGYKPEELFVTPSGTVIYDSNSAEEAASRDCEEHPADQSFLH